MREIETKYRVRDLEALLVALKADGVHMASPVRQEDQAYAPVGWDPAQGKVGFTFARLRTQDGHHVVTTKTPVANAMECVEHETGVADREAMHGVLTALGYEPFVRIAKTRRVGTTGPISVCVDEVENAGVFLELEILVSDDRDGRAAQDELDAWARDLGVDLERTSRTYDALVRRG
ncbi:class IV adenylate cyclase [Nocardiopsis sp. MG754419]|uniref:class IV adenylate cyclase n=1 Tax=Nocardiopsis sp. MG754419 TaxID=2259865 RepID=UPI001BA57FD5|nr:class IV adenylate cyclase [Nocardiopsis sp. MG754419]MBR8744211.1 class IV adenylate cyclase [Nocardiopsis sp. MG754419]